MKRKNEKYKAVSFSTLHHRKGSLKTSNARFNAVKLSQLLHKQIFRLPQSLKGSLKTQSNLILKGQPHENHHH